MEIHITEENFLREVENFYSAYDLSEKWWKTSHVTARGFDRDFPWMAAVVLWERLAPHIINSEKLNDMMQEGYRLCSEGKEDEGCRIWLEVWEHLRVTGRDFPVVEGGRRPGDPAVLVASSQGSTPLRI
ncbi:hypothetical protein SAMN02745218_02601 [Desulfofundulus australicus DSM 11792]|uniref:Uncharacterized protein n=1 Tax=Desulfofundulus australicus DSM 11792 TaxID=1121425 RepID=A0A1M5CQH6_9FIRM|nr:hypothetical protein [Desulfofundulus australicus]SHF56999.1 hypothetical protein SAMN02745218_02601 [Desulfofundulus australicus DSM 11792]